MSLADPANPAPPTEQTPAAETPNSQPSKKGKLNDELFQKTLSIAEKYKDKPWSEANKLIETAFKEAYPTAEKQPSRSTRYRALQEVTKEKRKLQKAAQSQTPSITIENETKKTPEFLNKEQPIEELPSIDPNQSVSAAPADIEYMKDMLRGIHDMILSKDGILGEKYGRSKEQVHAASDQLYRYISKRVDAAQLENYDLPLLVLCYAPLIIGVLNEVRKDRAKKAEKDKHP